MLWKGTGRAIDIIQYFAVMASDLWCTLYCFMVGGIKCRQCEQGISSDKHYLKIASMCYIVKRLNMVKIRRLHIFQGQITFFIPFKESR